MVKTLLKGFKDYADFESYADLLFNKSAEWNERLYNELLKYQETLDPVMAMRKIAAILYEQLVRNINRECENRG